MKIVLKKYGSVKLLYTLVLLFILLFASALRVLLIGLGWPITNSDEGTMGLMALHIAYHGEHPVFFYGQSYMGALEAYIAAIFFRLFGPSLFTLRLGLVLLFALFLYTIYQLTRLIYNKTYALLALIVLSFGSVEMLTRQLKAIGGLLETMFFGSLVLLLTTMLALSYPKDGNVENSWSRSFLYSVLGLAMGMGIWSNMLVLPFVGISFFILYCLCRKELQKKTMLFFCFGLFVGLLPLLIYDIEHPLENALFTLWQLHNSGGTAITKGFSFWDILSGTILVSIPMATGSPFMCSLSAVPGAWKGQISWCMFPQALWGIGYIVLWGVATWLEVKNLRTLVKTPMPRFYSTQRQIILHAARLAVLASAACTLLAFMASPAPALVPVTSARYLVGLLVAFPSILAPLWGAYVSRHTNTQHGKMLFVRRVAFITILFLLIYSTLGVFQQVPSTQALNKQRLVFIADLLRIHMTHIYSDYWTCNDVMFQSREKIICSVVDGDLQEGQNRYPLYKSIVQHDPHSAYVFPLNSSQAVLFARRAGNGTAHYKKVLVDNYVVYVPIAKT